MRASDRPCRAAQARPQRRASRSRQHGEGGIPGSAAHADVATCSNPEPIPCVDAPRRPEYATGNQRSLARSVASIGRTTGTFSPSRLPAGDVACPSTHPRQANSHVQRWVRDQFYSNRPRSECEPLQPLDADERRLLVTIAVALFWTNFEIKSAGTPVTLSEHLAFAPVRTRDAEGTPALSPTPRPVRPCPRPWLAH
jgi:hypothetical protein